MQPQQLVLLQKAPKLLLKKHSSLLHQIIKGPTHVGPLLFILYPFVY